MQFITQKLHDYERFHSILQIIPLSGKYLINDME